MNAYCYCDSRYKGLPYPEDGLPDVESETQRHPPMIEIVVHDGQIIARDAEGQTYSYARSPTNPRWVRILVEG